MRQYTLSCQNKQKMRRLEQTYLDLTGTLCFRERGGKNVYEYLIDNERLTRCQIDITKNEITTPIKN